jgi:hypothetical protein
MIEENFRLPNSKTRCKKCYCQYQEQSDDDDEPKGTLTQGRDVYGRGPLSPSASLVLNSSVM